MSDQHYALAFTMHQLLERSRDARVYVVAGIHTGRAILSNFFHVAELHGLVPDNDGIQEYSVIDNSKRQWVKVINAEDLVERKKWLVVAKLRWQMLESAKPQMVSA
jgi:EEF1A N-terminal glycine/lysine methyltransferase